MEHTQTVTIQLSKKFYFGVFLIISNFIVGKIAVPFFAVKVWIGTSIYLFSWLMLFAGLLLCGREGWTCAKKWYRNVEHKIMKNCTKIFKKE